MHKLALTLMCAYPLATLALTSNAVAAEEDCIFMTLI